MAPDNRAFSATFPAPETAAPDLRDCDHRTLPPAGEVSRLIEMYLAGISVRRVEDITEALWGTRVSPSTVSNLNKKIYAKIEAWRDRRIEGEHPYLYLDGIVMK
jgi:Transposase, Mutator family